MTAAEKAKAAVSIVLAVADTIREAGRVPSGTIYAALMAKGFTLSDHNAVIRTLQNTGLVELTAGHELIWRGPSRK